MTRFAVIPILILGCTSSGSGGSSNKDVVQADAPAAEELPPATDGEQTDTGAPPANLTQQWTMATDVPSEVAGTLVRDFGGYVGAGGGTIFLCGDGGLVRLRAPDGSWSARDIESTMPIRACHGLSDTELVAAADAGKVWRWSGKDGWELIELFEQSPGLRDVSLSADGKITVVGVQGSLYRYEDLVWKDQRVAGVTVTLQALWESPDDSLAIAGGEGVLLARKGGVWSSEALPPDPPGTPAGSPFIIRAIWGADASHIWAVGSLGKIAFRDATGTWTYQDSQWFATSFNAVFGLSATDVIVAADKGQVRRFDGTEWKVVEMKTPKKAPDGTPWPADQVVPNPPGSLDFIGGWASDEEHLWIMESTGKLVQFNDEYKL